MTTAVIEAPTADPVAASAAALDAVHARIERAEGVTAMELAEAEVALRLATKRRELAAKAAVKQAEADRLGRVAALRASLPARLDPAPVEQARAEMERAIGAYLDACRAHDDAMDAATEELRGLAPLPAGLAVDSPRYGQVTDGAAVHRRSRPQTTIAAIVTAAIRTRWPRQLVQLDRPQD